MLNKKIISLIISAALCLTAGACSYVSVNEDRDNAQIVAEVNGTPITKKQYKDTAATVLANFGMTMNDVKIFADIYAV